jgi:D-alanyl-D-alanine carboxypeptidase (penicillin-binding protein 5/6)
MTAYLTFKAVRERRLQLDQTLLASQKAWKTEGSRMFLDPKVPAKVSDLIKGMIVQSGNDACVTLAEGIAGSEEIFAGLMNREGKRLGLKNTHFTNATGLPDPKLYTTAYDLALLSTAIIRDFPEFYTTYAMRSFKYNGIEQPNRNLLLYRDQHVDGLKTGHTESAGFNLVASSKRGNQRMISVLIGAKSPEIRAVESSKLLNYALQFFDTLHLYKMGKEVSSVKVYKGVNENIPIGFDQDIAVTVPKGTTSKDLKVELVKQHPVTAPIRKGQSLGTLQVYHQEKLVIERPMVALQDMPEAGWFGRLWDSIRLWFA